MPFEMAVKTIVSPRCCIWGYSKKTVKKTFKLRILRIIILTQQNIKVSMIVRHAVGMCKLFIHWSTFFFSRTLWFSSLASYSAQNVMIVLPQYLLGEWFVLILFSKRIDL